MSGRAQPLLGTTLYSFTNEWVAGRFDFWELLELVADNGIGPGVEVVGFQSIRGFPDLTTEFVDRFRETTERLGLVPTALDSNVDVALRRDRYLTTEERVAYLAPQIEAARLLGFPLVRIQIGADPETLARVAPVAEEAGVRLGMEIHAAEGPHTRTIQAVVGAYDRIGSDRLGFIPDFSSTMRNLSDGLVRSFVRNGMPESLIPILREAWAADAPAGERRAVFMDAAHAAKVPDSALGTVGSAFTMNGHEDPAGWADLMPRVFHIHAKFYDIDGMGEEPAIDYAANLLPLREAGFAGSISSEWEGHPWTPERELDTFNVIRRQQELIRRVWAS